MEYGGHSDLRKTNSVVDHDRSVMCKTSSSLHHLATRLVHADKHHNSVPDGVSQWLTSMELRYQ